MTASTQNTARAVRSLLAVAIAGVCGQQGAIAQEAAAVEAAQPASGQLETVIVTAQRRAENIKDVPMAITTLKGEKLDTLMAGGQDIRFLSARAPSLAIESSFGRSFPRFYIRGLGNTDFDLNASQPVGLVYDDVVLENPLLKGFPLFDIDQVEVLRGPQGTLFGRNSPAGVIKFESAKPVFNTEGYLNAGIGNNRTRSLEGAFNLPLSETVAARLSIQSQHRDDRVHNPNPSGTTRDFEGYSDSAGRLQVLFKPTRQFQALLNLHGRDMDGNAMLFRANIMKKGTNELVDGFDYGSYPTDGGNQQWLKEKGGNLRLRWDLDGLTVHAISGYETVDFYSRGDVDGGIGCGFCGMPTSPGFIAFPVESADLLPRHKQFSQEVRIESNTQDALQWIAGMYYFDEDIRIDSITFDSLTKGSPQNSAYSTQTQTNKAWALFGSVNFMVDPALKVRAGLRYTNDAKDFVAQRFEPPVTGQRLPVSLDSSNISWDLSATYEMDRQTNLFGRIATGYRAPSVQGRLFGLPDSPSSAGAEKAISYEAGVKSELFNRRARLSATVFQYRISDKQLTAGSGTTNKNQLLNAGKVVGQGLELDFQANLSDALRATFGAGYNDTEIKDANLTVQSCGNATNNPATGCSVTNRTTQVNGTTIAFINGNPLPRAPKVTYNATLRFSQPVGQGEFFALTDWAYTGSYNMFLYEAKEYKAKPLLEGGLRIGYKWGTGKYELAAFGRNITNRIQTVGAIDFVNLTGMVNEPRIIGLQFKASF